MEMKRWNYTGMAIICAVLILLMLMHMKVYHGVGRDGSHELLYLRSHMDRKAEVRRAAAAAAAANAASSASGRRSLRSNGGRAFWHRVPSSPNPIQNS